MTPWRRGMGRYRRGGDGVGVGFAATLVVHAAAAGVLFARPRTPTILPPVYRVELVAAPRPEPEARRAPEVVERPAERAPPPVVQREPARRRTSVAREAPPREAQPEIQREPAPRTTPAEAPAPGVTPSTGTDVATVMVSGIEFRYPEYLRNIVAEVYRRWQRPLGGEALQAEILFFIHRDGSISNLQFTRRSGNFAFDLEAQGAVEAAGNSRAFGPLPEGYEADILPVNFFFNPRTLR
ncbi:MAG TPA: TonB C-terminal domain-containing protein [Gemmatimonadales bacterium]|nr:TonB C-terminal domain-containing protein [Gemmatimonadales bacterium]